MAHAPAGEGEGAEQGESTEAVSSCGEQNTWGPSPAGSLGSLGAVFEHIPTVGQGTQPPAAQPHQHQTGV